MQFELTQKLSEIESHRKAGTLDIPARALSEEIRTHLQELSQDILHSDAIANEKP